jgi:hypothetical protein
MYRPEASATSQLPLTNRVSWRLHLFPPPIAARLHPRKIQQHYRNGTRKISLQVHAEGHNIGWAVPVRKVLFLSAVGTNLHNEPAGIATNRANDPRHHDSCTMTRSAIWCLRVVCVWATKPLTNQQPRLLEEVRHHVQRCPIHQAVDSEYGQYSTVCASPAAAHGRAESVQAGGLAQAGVSHRA